MWKMHLQKNLHLYLHLHLHPHWRQSKSDHTLQEQGSQHARTLGNQPVHIVTFTCEMLSQPGSVDTQYNVLTLQKLVNKLFRLFLTMDTHIYRAVKSTSFRTINLRIHYLNLTVNSYCEFLSCTVRDSYREPGRVNLVNFEQFTLVYAL